MQPLNARRMDHEKTRKHLKDMWTKELKRMVSGVLFMLFPRRLLFI